MCSVFKLFIVNNPTSSRYAYIALVEADAGIHHKHLKAHNTTLRYTIWFLGIFSVSIIEYFAYSWTDTEITNKTAAWKNTFEKNATTMYHLFRDSSLLSIPSISIISVYHTAGIQTWSQKCNHEQSTIVGV